MRSMLVSLAALGLSLFGMALYGAKGFEKADSRVFELRTYYCPAGKMDALQARFRDHTCKLFEKHHMTIIGFWNPTDAEQAQQKLVYLLAFPSRQAAAQSWKDFQADPEWKAVKEASEKNGKLVERVESVYLNATDYSPLK
ncbi:MAG TPA: NIPSNAP family protein [Pirellulales bacterium]|jgi:hypothetical protein|nr:NIPSNAP family protein [Pirellulales bacterium]